MAARFVASLGVAVVVTRPAAWTQVQVSSKPVSNWRESDVRAWLTSLGLGQTAKDGLKGLNGKVGIRSGLVKTAFTPLECIYSNTGTALTPVYATVQKAVLWMSDAEVGAVEGLNWPDRALLLTAVAELRTKV
jgi:hypothetical protein